MVTDLDPYELPEDGRRRELTCPARLFVEGGLVFRCLVETKYHANRAHRATVDGGVFTPFLDAYGARKSRDIYWNDGLPLRWPLSDGE